MSAVPKSTGIQRRTLPIFPDDASGCGLEYFLGGLAPDERKALDWIVENADLIHVEDRAWLLVPASPFLIDTLAAFGAEAEDRENDLEDEPSEDREHDPCDDAPSLCGEGGPLEAVDGEPDGSMAPAGALKSAEAFRARGLPGNARRRARVEARKLNVFLRRVGSDTVEVRNGVLTFSRDWR